MSAELYPDKELHGLTLLWIDNWWDSPLSGVVVYQGAEHWFDAVWSDQEDDWTVPRVFCLYAMDAGQREQAWVRHRFFEEKVGTTYCYHPGVERGTQRPQTTWHEFYDRYPPGTGQRPHREGAVGWFHETELGDFRPKRPG